MIHINKLFLIFVNLILVTGCASNLTNNITQEEETLVIKKNEINYKFNKLPKEINDQQLRSELLKNHNIEISAGLGTLSGQVWRIGLMGENSKRENVFRFLEALEIELKAQGMNVSAKEAINQLA